jgi:phosphohistidine phosphatase
MKTLYLMRHAKSSWKDPDLADHERPLNKRGKKDAPEMGRRLKKQGVQLDIIVSSDAKRAMDTAAAVATILGLPSKLIRPTTVLYHGSPDRILDVVYALKNKWKQAMVVGHNPGFTELANRFYPHAITNVPTAGIVALGFDVSSWRHIERGNLDFSYFDYPKNR